MTVVLFEPHHDDATLFASYTMLRERPTLVTVFGFAQAQERYGVSAETRDHENIDAIRLLEPAGWQPWDHSDLTPDRAAIIAHMLRLNAVLHPRLVWAPMFEQNGHEHHNLVARCAEIAFSGRVRSYATYSRGSKRTQTENEVIPEPDWPALKLKAMACYTSQINLENTRPWFAADDMLREWVA